MISFHLSSLSFRSSRLENEASTHVSENVRENSYASIAAKLQFSLHLIFL